MNSIFLYVGWAKMPSNIILQHSRCNWPCYRNLKVLKISHEIILSLKHSALGLCVRFILQMVSKLTVTQWKLFLLFFFLLFLNKIFSNHISPSVNLQNPSFAAHIHCHHNISASSLGNEMNTAKFLADLVLLTAHFSFKSVRYSLYICNRRK